MEFGTEGFDGWVVSGGVHPVGEKNHFEFPNGIDPDTGAGKPQMAERLRGKPLAGGRGASRRIPS